MAERAALTLARAGIEAFNAADWPRLRDVLAPCGAAPGSTAVGSSGRVSE